MILDGYESLGFDEELEFDNKKIWEDIDCVIESLTLMCVSSRF
jgi:hypothetical protein